MDIRNITVMLMAGDEARVDIAITPARTYYRYATDSSIDDGELDVVENFETVAQSIVEAASPRDGEQPLDGGVRLQFFVNNRISSGRPTVQSLDRLIGVLMPLAAEFSFLKDFRS